ncbi:MAG: hypothetical protein ACLRO1_04780 [Agathobaculum sp.]
MKMKAAAFIFCSMRFRATETAKAGARRARFFASPDASRRRGALYCVLTGTNAEYFIKICTLLLAKARKNML